MGTLILLRVKSFILSVGIKDIKQENADVVLDEKFRKRERLSRLFPVSEAFVTQSE